MSYEPCNHLGNAGLCTDSPPPGTNDPKVCMCTNTAKDRIWPRIKNVHLTADGRLTKRASAPSGIEAVYDFEHVVGTSPHTGEAIDGPSVSYSGGEVTFLIHYVANGQDAVLTIIMDQPEGC